MAPFSLPVRVYIEDTDAGGIVYYVNYLKYFERARTELFRQLGFAKPAFIEQDKMLVVASAHTRYTMPARLDDELQVTAKITMCKNTYMVFEQIIFKGEDSCCNSEIKIACVSRTDMRPAVIPAEIRKAIDGTMASKMKS